MASPAGAARRASTRQARHSTYACPHRARASSRFIRRNGGLFVAEPVSHANAAMNAPEECWSELGMEILEPG